jgi:glycine cleavage system H protein
MVQARQYQVPTDRLYEPGTNMWVQVRGAVVRVGFDELGQETHGDVAFLQLAEPGARLLRGQELGSLEAGKYVGPVVSPLAGTICAVNPAVLDNPRLINIDPLGSGWLVELVPAEGEPLDQLLSEPDKIRAWFADRVREFRAKGVLAE